MQVTLQGFCYPSIGPDTMTKEYYLNKAKDLVKAIRTGMKQKLDGLKVPRGKRDLYLAGNLKVPPYDIQLNDSVPWTCEEQEEPTTRAPTGITKPANVTVTERFGTTTSVPAVHATEFREGLKVLSRNVPREMR